MQVGSVAAMIIGQRHVPTSTFGFESDSLDALSNHEIDAAAVTPTAASYFNLTHPDKAFRILDRDEFRSRSQLECRGRHGPSG